MSASHGPTPNTIPELVDARLDGEIADADWQRLIAERGPALASALAREHSVRASVRALPRTRAPDAVRAAIMAHAAQALPSTVSSTTPSTAAPDIDGATQPTHEAKPTARVIRGGWWWTMSALAAACLVVTISMHHEPAGRDPGLVAFGKEPSLTQPATAESDGKPRRNRELAERKLSSAAADSPASPDEENPVAILEQGARRDPGQPASSFGDRAKRADGAVENLKDTAGAKADAVAGASNKHDELQLSTKRPWEDADAKEELALAEHGAAAASEEKLASDRLDGASADKTQRAADAFSAGVDIADTAVDDAKKSKDSKDSVVAYQRAPTESAADDAAHDKKVVRSGGARQTTAAPAATTGKAAQASAPGAAPAAAADEAEVAANELRAKVDAVKVGADGEASANGAVSTDDQRKLGKVATAPAAPPAGVATSAPAKPASPPPTAVSAVTTARDIGIILSLGEGKATMTVENRGGQALVVRRSTLVLVGLDRSQRSCWIHATGLPAADETVAAHQKRSWAFTLQGADSPTPDSVQLRARLQAQESPALDWPPATAPAAASAADAPAAKPAP